MIESPKMNDIPNLPKEFDDFIAPNADRRAIIRDYLAQRGVETAVISLDGKNHIFVKFAKSAYSPLFKLKTVLCHYDRVETSPGANDNSAACFQIMDWAVRLSRFRGVHNIRIFFTDGEEIAGHSSVKDQGAFALASLYRRLGITKDDVYVFDSCGRGNIALISEKTLSHAMKGNLARLYEDLCKRTEQLLSTVCPKHYFSLPMPYSDNAGFLACGIPAVVITVLPANEVEQFARNLLENKNLKQSVLNPSERDSSYKEKLPLTWQMFHTAADTKENLTEESFELMQSLLDALALSKTISR